MLNKRLRKEKTKTFKWDDLPKCTNRVVGTQPNGVKLVLCKARKGSGRHNQYCTYVGIEAKCPHYKPKHKWGRSIYEMVGDLI
jgi:hypothetical protein